MEATLARLRRRLEPVYGTGETQAIIRIIFRYLFGWSAVDMFMHDDAEIGPEAQEAINHIVKRLEDHEPIQYITGIAPFYGMEFHVDRRVLIPRPETEQLVDMIVDRYNSQEDLKVLDICTGSGCIAIALARNLPFSQVTALDDSPGAIEVAQENARRLKAKIKFVTADIFDYSTAADEYDIVVSNPPYVDESEKKDMDANVLDYEPGHALFVPDDNPLLYYSRIAEVAYNGLKPDGTLWLEINPLHAEALKALLASHGYTDISLINDIHGRVRFASARKPSADA